MNWTTGLLTDLARASFMFEARLCSFDLFESLGLMILGIEYLDQPVGVDRLLGDARDVAHRILNALAVAPETAIDHLHQPTDQRAPPQMQNSASRQFKWNSHASISRRSSAASPMSEIDGAGRRIRDQLDVVGELGRAGGRTAGGRDRRWASRR